MNYPQQEENHNNENLLVAVVDHDERRYLKRFLWWGLIHRGTDFFVLGWIVAAPLIGTALLFIALSSSMSNHRMTAPTAVMLAFGGTALWLSAVACFVHRSHQKWLLHVRRRMEHSASLRGRCYFYRHTAMEIFVVAATAAVLTGLEYLYDVREEEKHNDHDDIDHDDDDNDSSGVRTVASLLVHIQLFAATVVFCRYYYRVQDIAYCIQQNVIPPKGQHILLVWIHMVSAALILRSMSDLMHLAMAQNAWTMPLYLMEAWFIVGVIGRACTVPPPPTTTAAPFLPSLEETTAPEP